MAKPRIYGMRATDPKMANHLERCFWEKAQRRKRNREKAQRTLTTSGPVREVMEEAARNPDPNPLPLWPKENPNKKAVPAYLDDRTESGLLEE